MQFIKKHWKKLLCVLIFVGALFFLVNLLPKLDRSIIIGDPNNIILISPEESQDVIVIGDPEQIKVKPKNHK